MIGPAGSTRHPGRIIDGNYERGLTIQLAEQLKTALQEKHPSVAVLILRSSTGQNSLEHATIANRLSVDLYLALMLYEQQEATPHISLFTYATHPNDRFKKINGTTLHFLPYDQAHTLQGHTSAQWAQRILDELQRTPLFIIPGDTVHTIPLQPLKGICAPHIGIELSVQSATDISNYIPSLSKALGALIEIQETA